MSFFHRLLFEAPESEHDWLSLELVARGADGVSVEETGGVVRLVAWCPDPLPAELEKGVLGDGNSSWPARGIRLLTRERCESRDWMAAWRAASKPVTIGRRFVVDPREPDEVPSAEPSVASTDERRILLRVPARRAFGTGGHASTRMVLEWLEDLDLEGRSVLDLGSGTGILSLAALALGATSAVGLDNDPVACFVASEIVRLNPPRPLLAAGDLSCLGEAAFDVALVNILPGEWLEAAGELARVLAAEGLAILSGLPSDQADEVSARLAEAGLHEVERRREAEWTALAARRPGPVSDPMP